MQKNIVAFAGLFIWAAVASLIAADTKVPADIGVRIRNVQLDVSRIQTQLLQLQQQYQTDQTTLQHDQGELDDLKKEALTAQHLDAKDWDVDTEKLEFVAKPKPAAPEAKK
jgi:hypothetical protein